MMKEQRRFSEKYQDKAFTKDDLEFAGFYLYLCVETGIYRDQEQALRKLRNFHMQKEDSFTLLWVLLRKDPELCQLCVQGDFYDGGSSH